MIDDKIITARMHRTLILAIAAIMTVVIIMQIWACRNLFVDGSVFFAGKLISREFSFIDPPRLYARLLLQWPVVPALKMGVTDLDTLIHVHGFGLHVTPVLIWGIGLFRLRNNPLFWPFLMMFLIVHFSICFISVSESNIAYALAGLCLALIINGMKNKLDHFLLAIAAILLTRAYETTFLLTPLLILLSLIHFKKSSSPAYKCYWLFIGAIFAYSIYICAMSLIYLSVDKHPEYAGNIYYPFKNAQVWISMLCSALVGYGLLTGSMKKRRAVFLVACLTSLSLFIPSLQSTVQSNVQLRAYITLFIACYSAFLAWLSFKIDHDDSGTISQRCRTFAPVLPIFLMFIAFTEADIDKSVHYRQFVNLIRHEVNTKTGVVKYEDTALFVPQYDQYTVMWTMPTLSMLLRKSEKGAIIKVPGTWGDQWQPFDPYNMPDFNRYYEGKNGA